MVIARVESLILEAGMDDAVERAKAYLGAGADGIMIHSRKKIQLKYLNFAGNMLNFERKSHWLWFPQASILSRKMN